MRHEYHQATFKSFLSQILFFCQREAPGTWRLKGPRRGVKKSFAFSDAQKSLREKRSRYLVLDLSFNLSLSSIDKQKEVNKVKT